MPAVDSLLFGLDREPFAPEVLAVDRIRGRYEIRLADGQRPQEPGSPRILGPPRIIVGNALG